MLGTKIRSWMEAHIVRPRKKQHRSKEGMKKRFENINADIILTKDKINDYKSSELPCMPETSTKKCQKESTKVDDYVQSNNVSLSDSNKIVTLRGQSRNRLHHNNNLSSPESAYSTGYSTDGTSPGASFPATTAPPEYYINIRTGIRYFHSTTSETTNTTVQEPKRPWEPNPEPISLPVNTNKMTSPALNSPRQRNRIRTNPWVPENIRNNCKCSPLTSRLTPDYIGNNRTFRNGNMYHVINTSSPVRKKWTYTEQKQHCRFSSSSSASSTSSISSVHAALVQHKASSEDDDDRTLNEMMGKYDESYVYEKETDILSDSDPTDCDEDYNESDAEDGREGGDERDLLDDDEDLDFIDNGSLELNILEDHYINKGHCTYHMFGDTVPLRDTSRISRRNVSTPTNMRRRRSSERRIRRTSSKKKRDRYLESQIAEFNRLQLKSKIPGIYDGPRSAGNTPVCIRRRRAMDEYHENRFEKRCNSISTGPMFRRNSHHKTSDFNISFTERDKEADKKYKELIIEAEHILMSMKTFRPPVTSSPKKPALANKRVELIKNSECGEIKAPCGVTDPYGSFKEPLSKLSPKKNHITNFINNNSPVILRRDLEKDIPKQVSPLAIRKERTSEAKNPIVTFRSAELSRLNDNSCPQSEPVKRKIYGNPSLNADLQMMNDAGKINRSSCNNSVKIISDDKFKDEEEYKQQKLFHTLSSLKRNLESQSEALKQSYDSSNHMLNRAAQW